MKTSFSILTTALLFSAAGAQAQEITRLPEPLMIAASAVNTAIHCHSADKKVSLDGYVPADTYYGDLTLRSSGNTITFKQDLDDGTHKLTGEQIVFAEDVLDGVLTVKASSELSQPTKSLSLIAKPKSMKGSANHVLYKVQFLAELNGFQERDAGNVQVSTEVACEASYRMN